MKSIKEDFEVMAKNAEYSTIRATLERGGVQRVFEYEVPNHGIDAQTLYEFRASGGEQRAWEDFNRE